MKHPSKRVALMQGAANRRQQAIENNDTEAFALAVQELAELDAQPDVFTCLTCGQDFGLTGPHMDLLIASAMLWQDAYVTQQVDYGVREVQVRPENGRRIKICGTCLATWPLPIFDYLSLR